VRSQRFPSPLSQWDNLCYDFRTAPTILAAVLALLKKHNASSVIVTGHSLGAALALLDSVYLQLYMPAGTRVSMVGFGMPRVGNPAFADYVDAMHSASSVAVTVTHINNKKDPIPIVPGRFMGFAHPAGEVHIQDDSSNSWVSCPGHDNPSLLCSVGDVPNVLQSNILDHLGPYDDDISMGLC
jgi:predicted lipase